MASSYKLLSVDVWDTLLLRRCHPDTVKLQTANQLLLHHENRLTPALRDAHALLRLRLNIEADQAQLSVSDPNRDDEYLLSEVLDAWLAKTVSMPAGERCKWVKLLAECEWQQECLVSEADSAAVEIVQAYTAKKRIFLSDFYMPAPELKRLLDAKGLSQLFDGGYCSCDEGVNKRSGRLFTLMHARCGVKPQEHLHIGDNPVSDSKAPRKLGIQVVAYRNRLQQSRTRRYAKHLWNRRTLFDELRRQCKRLPTLESRAQRRAYRYGIHLAPLFAGFSLFVLENALREQHDRTYFLSREGELFAETCKIVRRASPHLSANTPEPAVLEVSRLSTFAASLREISIEEMMRLWVAYPTQSLKAWALSLDLPLDWIQKLARREQIDFEQPLRQPWKDQRIRHLFTEPDFRKRLLRHVADRRQRLLAYLAAQGLSQARNIGLIDIGWRGTMQDNLAWLLPQQQFHGSYLGLQKFQSRQPPNSSKSSYGTNLNLSITTQEFNFRLFANLPLMEMLSNSMRGSVVGYEIDRADKAIALRRIDAQENAVHQTSIASVQHGILAGVRIWARALHDQSLRSLECRPLALQLWHRAVHRPPRFMRLALRELHHNEIFGRGQISTTETI